MKYQVMVLAAGQGKRMGAGKNKLFLELNGSPIILHTLHIFLNDSKCSKIILVTHSKEEAAFQKLLSHVAGREKIVFVHGGAERQNSVYNGLKKADNEKIVLVHDGARPFVDQIVIQQLVELANQKGAAVVAVPVKDTIKRVAKQQVVETIERSSLWQVQTPQAFRVSILRDAHEQAALDQYLGTDDASLVERMMHPVHIIEGSYDNIKLTTSEDLYFAQAIIKKRIHTRG